MITPELAVSIADRIDGETLDEAVVSGLREAWPDLHFTYCLDDDIINGKPVLERDGFNIYLVDGREHCLCLTNDYETATGVVLAEVIDDDWG